MQRDLVIWKVCYFVSWLIRERHALRLPRTNLCIPMKYISWVNCLSVKDLNPKQRGKLKQNLQGRWLCGSGTVKVIKRSLKHNKHLSGWCAEEGIG